MPETAAKLPIIRNSGNVAIWLLVRSPALSVAKALEDRRKADEQRRADDTDQRRDRGERHLAEHQDPHQAKAMPTALPGLSCAQSRHAGEIEQTHKRRRQRSTIASTTAITVATG